MIDIEAWYGGWRRTLLLTAWYGVFGYLIHLVLGNGHEAFCVPASMGSGFVVGCFMHWMQRDSDPPAPQRRPEEGGDDR